MGIDKLYDILMDYDVVSSIDNNLEVLLELIPEITSMIGFSHKHPHHHLDVWEHTKLALSYSDMDFDVRVVLLLHDIGKPYSYQEGDVRHFKGHPVVSSSMAYNILVRLGFSYDKVKQLCYLILEHDSLITNEDIALDRELTVIRFRIQCCDALAHNPMKLEKRIKYLLFMNEKVNEDIDKEKCKKLIYSVTK